MEWRGLYFRWHLPRAVFFGHGTLVPKCVLWISLDIEGPKVGILNIYAPTDLWQRATFWRTLADIIPAMDSWVVGSDFSYLEPLEDL